jgi:hypothetical protein
MPPSTRAPTPSCLRPHVLRGMERHRGRPIAHSLGNLGGYRNFATGGELSVSAVLELRLAPDGVLRGGRVHALRLDADGVPSPDPMGAAAAMMRDVSGEDFGSHALGPDHAGRLR